MIKINVVKAYPAGHLQFKGTSYGGTDEYVKEILGEMPKQDCSCGCETIITIDGYTKNIVYCCDVFKNFYLQSYDTDPYEWEMVRGNTQEELNSIVGDYVKKGWTDEGIYAAISTPILSTSVKNTGAYKKLLKRLRESKKTIIMNGSQLYEDASNISKKAIKIKENLILNGIIYNVSNPIINVTIINDIDLIMHKDEDFNVLMHGNLEGDYHEIISIV